MMKRLPLWAGDKFFGGMIGALAVILLAVAGITIANPDTKNPIKAVFEITQTITVDIGDVKEELDDQGRKLDEIIVELESLVREALHRNALLEEMLRER